MITVVIETFARC